MPLIINLVTYCTVYAYIITVSINFFHPITKGVSIIIIIGSVFLSAISARFVPLNLFTFPERIKRVSKIWIRLGLFCLFSWFIIVIFRPAADVDSNIYHLPVSILMNRSVWYPGIGKLSSHFGFPNGNSVLSSVFTSFGVVGFENIPNMILWVIFGMGIFMYLVKNRISMLISFFVSLLFLFTPALFWRSYNMGTDLPCVCFFVFGLLSLRDRKLKDSVLFFSLAAVFKTFGTIAFLLTMAYIVIMKLLRKGKVSLLHPKMVLAYLLFIIFSIRIFIATGNPVYPALHLYFVPWAVDQGAQINLVRQSFQGYINVERTPAGFLAFIKDFLFNPRAVKSSYWFSPFFLICFISSLRAFFKQRAYRNINPHSVFICFLIFIIFAIWFTINPLFRLVSGVLIFITLQLFIFSRRFYLPKLCSAAIYSSLFLTLSLFLYNAALHIGRDVIPFVFPSSENIEKLLPFDYDIFTTVKTQDGFEYSESSSTYLGRVSVLPCLSRHSVGDRDELVKEYRRHNGLLKTK